MGRVRQSGDAAGHPRAPHGARLEEGRREAEDPLGEPADHVGRHEHREEPSGAWACQWAPEVPHSEGGAGRRERRGEAPHGADQRAQDQRGDQWAYAGEHRAHDAGPSGPG